MSKPTDEWYTGPEIIEACIEVFDAGYFDPCGCPGTPATSASSAYGVYADGFDARTDDFPEDLAVYLNPPYSKPDPFIENFLRNLGYFDDALVERRMTAGSCEGILVVNASTASAWYQSAFAHADAVCMPAPRIRFLRRPLEGEEPDVGLFVRPKSPRYNNTIMYFGPNAYEFVEVFSAFGITRRLV